MKKILLTLVVGAVAFAFSLSGVAQAEIIWGNSYGDNISAYDLTTGTELHHFTTGLGNGRGIVQVGNTLYVTVANSGTVSMIDATTGIGMGSAFTVAGASGLSTIAYDGANFWIGDYSGTNHVYEYSSGGALLKTISLGNCTGYCDGLEYFNGKLISNRIDGCCGSDHNYDIYDLDGNLLTSGFINPTTLSTGIAYDGTNFFTSNIFNNSISEWDGTTGAFIKTVTLLSNHNGIEDLSFNYSEDCNLKGTCPTVPEPSTLWLMGVGLIGVAIWGRKRISVV